MTGIRGYYEKPVPLKQYISDKIDMLEYEFCLRLTKAEVDHFYALKTETDVDRYSHQLLLEKL